MNKKNTSEEVKKEIEMIKKQNLASDGKVILEMIFGNDCDIPYVNLNVNGANVQQILYLLKSMDMVKYELFNRLAGLGVKELYEEMKIPETNCITIEENGETKIKNNAHIAYSEWED